MRLRKRAVAVVFVVAAAFTTLAPQAMAAPMPWETGETPTTTTRHATVDAIGGSSTITLMCGNPCYR
ncbi:hypothetical protein OHU34_04820 [Streptomyces sp. NBC_00080]|uniref:hypothetical protein n=1 Tax=Streptomyces TaxID=1883 RepID=UPI0011509285|nr:MULTISPECIES: hypothetical protein [Streptomyces]TQJ57530.1 hypothetical protein FBY34_5389 [Streptomyces sp. SLBN-115]